VKRQTEAERILGDADASLLDVVDNVLNKGVVLTGDLTIGLAQVDLVYARLSVLLCAADRVLPTESTDVPRRRRARRANRALSARIHEATAVYRAEPSHVRNAPPSVTSPGLTRPGLPRRPARAKKRG
jgi:Gas vesicle protein